MKVEKLIENRIEKHLDLVDENNKEILNTSEILPATINGEGDKNTDFQYVTKAKGLYILNFYVRMCIDR